MARKSGFTLLELLVVIAVIGVLASLTSSVIAHAHSEAQATQCVSNLRQWGVALNLYCADNYGYTPRRGQGVQPVTIINRSTDWFNALPPYLGMATFNDLVQQGNPPQAGANSIFVCPAAKLGTAGPYFLAYAMNMYLSPWIRPQPHKLQELPNPSQLAFMADGPSCWASTVPSSQGYSVVARHEGRANVAFVDGHVESFDGTYLGCGIGEPNPELSDCRWQTLTDGVNQTPVP